MIGKLKEKSLHASLKDWYSRNISEQEVIVKNYSIDVFKDSEIIEIQTGSFSNIKPKLQNLLQDYKVRLVYPIPLLKTIVMLSRDKKKTLYQRRSPKHGSIHLAADELVFIPNIIQHPNFTFEILLTQEQDIRCNDGCGSWRRKGISLIDRKLIKIDKSIQFNKPKDYAKLLPKSLPQPFTNQDLAQLPHFRYRRAAKLTNFLRNIQVLEVIKKTGNTQVFCLV